jgi:transposase
VKFVSRIDAAAYHALLKQSPTSMAGAPASTMGPTQEDVFGLLKDNLTLVRQQTMLIDAIRGHMSELGMIAPQGSGKII